jgi:hypothetical protein
LFIVEFKIIEEFSDDENKGFVEKGFVFILLKDDIGFLVSCDRFWIVSDSAYTCKANSLLLLLIKESKIFENSNLVSDD